MSASRRSMHVSRAGHSLCGMVPQLQSKPVFQHIREFVQKPHEPHAAFVHCAKPHDKMKNL
jgi:hypothetical protein